MKNKALILLLIASLSSMGLPVSAAEDLAISREKLPGAKTKSANEKYEQQGETFVLQPSTFELPSLDGDFGPYYLPDGLHEYSPWDFYLKTRNQHGFPDTYHIPMGPAEMQIPISEDMVPIDTSTVDTSLIDSSKENLSKHLSKALEQRFTFLAKFGFKHSPQLRTTVSCVLMPDGTIRDLHVDKKSTNTLFDIIAFQSIKSMDGDKQWDSKMPLHCTWSFNVTNGISTVSLAILKKPNARSSTVESAPKLKEENIPLSSRSIKPDYELKPSPPVGTLIIKENLYSDEENEPKLFK